MQLATGTQLDRYHLLDELGRGGMATVYRVRHEMLDSIHVLKVLHVRAPGLRERLLLEGKVQAKLKHPNVVEVTDVIDVNGALGLVMEFVDGPTLDDVLRAGPMSLENVKHLVPGILSGVAAAHADGVVHRDLKPANILLSLKHGKIVPKVADFGLVKQLASEGEAKTRTGVGMGTPQYMAPEQVQDAKDVDERADVWALGVILYELVTHTRPFDGDTAFHILQRVVSREFRPVHEARPDLPSGMRQAIEAALSPRDERPQTVEALWSLWSQDDRPLHAASSVHMDFEAGLFDTLKSLAPSANSFSSSQSQATYVTSPPPDSNNTTAFTTAQTDPVFAPAPVPEADPSTPTDRRWIGLILGVGLLALLGVWAWTRATPPVPAPPTDVRPAPVLQEPPPTPPPVVVPTEPPAPVAPAPEPPAVPAPEPPPPPVAPAPPRPVPTPVAPAEPAPEPQAPEPVVARAASETGHVKVVVQPADTPIRLRGTDGVHPPGRLSPGRYRVEMQLDGRWERTVEVVVTAGETATVRCSASLGRCR